MAINSQLLSIQARFSMLGMRFEAECLGELRTELSRAAIQVECLTRDDWSNANALELLIQLRAIKREMETTGAKQLAPVVEAAIRNLVKRSIHSVAVAQAGTKPYRASN